MTEAPTTLSLDDVEALSHRMLRACGAAEHQARPTAHSMREAEAQGIRDVGLSYLPTYCDQLLEGKVHGDAVPVVSSPRPSVVVVDAAHGFSHAAFVAGESTLVTAARAQGIAVMSVHHSYSAGVLGWFVERLAAAGLVAVMTANSNALVAPHGGARPFFGTNPLAWATPRRSGPPVVADLSTSATAWVRIKAAADAGQPLPHGWAVDEHGNPTTDPHAGLQGSVAPLGGAKGTALAMLVDVLAGGLTGSNFSFEASSLVAPGGGPPELGQLFIAIDPGATAGDAFADRLEVMLAALTAQDGVRLPGDRRHAHRAAAERDGVQVPAALMSTLQSYVERAA